MAKVTWIGVGGDAETTEIYGYVFQKGKPVDVSDPGIFNQLRGNPVFIVEGGETKEGRENEKLWKEYNKQQENSEEERKKSVADARAAQLAVDKKAADEAAKRKAEADKAAAEDLKLRRDRPGHR